MFIFNTKLYALDEQVLPKEDQKIMSTKTKEDAHLQKTKEPFKLPELSVKADVSLHERNRLDDPVLKTGITRDIFEKRNNRRAGDVLKRLSGVLMGGPPGENKDVRLRGMDKEFTRIQVDGVQLPGGGEKREFQVNRIPSFMLGEVNIIRNPTAEYESDGIAGRVDIKTRPIPEELTIEGRIGNGGRDDLKDDLFNGNIGFGYRPTKWFGIMGTFDRQKNRFEKDKFKQFSSGKNEDEDESERQITNDISLDMGFFYDSGEFHLKPVIFNLDKDKTKTKIIKDPGKDTKKDNEIENSVQQTKGLGFTHQHTFSSGLKWDTLGGYYRTKENKDKNKPSFKDSLDNGVFVIDKTTLENEDKRDKTWNLSSSLTFPFKLGLKQELKFGGALRLRQRFRNKRKFEIKNGATKNITTPKDSYRLTDDYIAGFIQDTVWLTPRLSIIPGVRVENVSLNSRSGATTDSKDITDVNPSLHLLYKVRDDMSFHSAVSRAVNRPKFDELAPFEDEKGDKFVIGNPDLDPAISWNIDMGTEYTTDNIFLGVNLFYKNIRDMIEEVDTGVDKNGKDVFKFQNVGNGWTRGLELEQRLGLGITGIEALRDLTIWANETFLKSEIRRDPPIRRKRFKEQPSIIANAGIDYTYNPWGTIFSISWNYIGERKDFQTTKIKTIERSSTIDLAVRQNVYKNASFFLEVENISNEGKREREISSNNSRKTEKTGRTFLFGLNWKL
jgi:outer membrane receptor protein involved in Fe transport